MSSAMQVLADLEARLERLLTTRPDLVEVAELHGALQRELYLAAPSFQAPVLPRERALRKLAARVPLLHEEDLEPDIGFCTDLCGRLLNLLQQRPASRVAASEIARSIAGGQLDFEHALVEALAGHADHLAEVASWNGLEAEMLGSLLSLVARPTLEKLAADYCSLLDGQVWEAGYCPICGAWPGMAELQLAEQHRHLRCLQCGADWPARRLQCAFCGNDQHGQLGYLQGEREPRYRVEICEQCRGFLKVVNAFQPNTLAHLALDDLASVHLDVAAMERGYQRPAGRGFRLELGEREPDEGLADLLETD